MYRLHLYNVTGVLDGTQKWSGNLLFGRMLLCRVGLKIAF